MNLIATYIGAYSIVFFKVKCLDKEWRGQTKGRGVRQKVKGQDEKKRDKSIRGTRQKM